MRELFSISGEYWTVPIWVDHSYEGKVGAGIVCVRIGAGVPLLKKQRTLALEKLIQAGATFSEGKHFIEFGKLLSIAQREEKGMDPEDVVYWRPLHQKVTYTCPKPKNPKQAARKEKDEFFYEFSRKGWIRNPVQAEILWNAFMLHTLDWIINECKPVNFVFFELSACPFRPEWKEIMAFWKEQVQCYTSHQDYYEYSRDPRIFAFDQKTQLFVMGLEVRPLDIWYKHVRTVETKRKEHFQNTFQPSKVMTHYGNNYARIARFKYADALAPYLRQYLTDSERDVLWSSKKRIYRTRYLRSALRKNKPPFVTPIRPTVAWIVRAGNSTPPEGQSGKLKRSDPAIENVYPMRALFYPRHDLWFSLRPNVEEQEDWEI